MTTILLARHGESDWNRDRRWQGHADRPLTDLGREQAHVLADRLATTELDAVYSSDLERARETAAIVAEPHRLPVRELSDLREVDVGLLVRPDTGGGRGAVSGCVSSLDRGGEGWDDGETYEQLSERVVGAVLAIAARHPHGRVLVVAHGGSIRAVHATALGVDVHTYRRIQRVEPNATLSAVGVEDGRVTELCRAEDLDRFLLEDQQRRRAAAARPSTPAG